MACRIKSNFWAWHVWAPLHLTGAKCQAPLLWLTSPGPYVHIHKQFQVPGQLIPVLITVLWGVLSAFPPPELELTLFELTLQNPFPKENFPQGVTYSVLCSQSLVYIYLFSHLSYCIKMTCLQSSLPIRGSSKGKWAVFLIFAPSIVFFFLQITALLRESIYKIHSFKLSNSVIFLIFRIMQLAPLFNRETFSSPSKRNSLLIKQSLLFFPSPKPLGQH